MKMKHIQKHLFGTTMTFAILALLLSAGPASAALTTGTLQIGGDYGNITHGGSFQVSFWTPDQPVGAATETMLFLYCIDVFDYINSPGLYRYTTVTTTGDIDYTQPPASVVPASWTFQPHAGQIAWLLAKYAATVTSPDSIEGMAVQEAVWKVMYGAGFWYAGGGVLPQDAKDAANAYYAASIGKSGNVEEFLWFSPHLSSNYSDIRQAQVGVPVGTHLHTPDGGMTLMLLGGALVGIAALRWKFNG